MASSQRRPESILIWLPTWPDMAMLGSGSPASSVEAAADDLDAGAAAADLDDLADRLVARDAGCAARGRIVGRESGAVLGAGKLCRFIASVMRRAPSKRTSRRPRRKRVNKRFPLR